MTYPETGGEQAGSSGHTVDEDFGPRLSTNFRLRSFLFKQNAQRRENPSKFWGAILAGVLTTSAGGWMIADVATNAPGRQLPSRGEAVMEVNGCTAYGKMPLPLLLGPNQSLTWDALVSDATQGNKGPIDINGKACQAYSTFGSIIARYNGIAFTGYDGPVEAGGLQHEGSGYVLYVPKELDS
jgi:hypothetical protein